MARQQLTTEDKRQLIADQLGETPERSNRWIARQLGVSHPTVASVRQRTGINWKSFPVGRYY
jgi:IS30 family transposase